MAGSPTEGAATPPAPGNNYAVSAWTQNTCRFVVVGDGHSPTFSPDGKHLASASADRSDSGVPGELQVVGRVADHQRLRGLGPAALHQREQHVGMRLGKSLVGTARSDEAMRERLFFFDRQHGNLVHRADVRIQRTERARDREVGGDEGEGGADFGHGRDSSDGHL